jgi:predicted transcriptional regulator
MTAYRTTIKFWNSARKQIEIIQTEDAAYDAFSQVESSIKSFKEAYPHTSVISIKCEPIS